MADANSSAFPVKWTLAQMAGLQDEKISLGLTKREIAAFMAMQGLLASEVDCPECSNRFETCADYSVRHADALLAALAKDGGEGKDEKD